MHRGYFVWTQTPPLSGRRAPCLGPTRVCVCLPFLAGSGGPASRARSGAPHLSCCLSCALFPSGLGLPCLWVLLGFFFLFPFPVAPPLFPALRVFRPGVPWAFASCCPPFPPPLFFLSLLFLCPLFFFFSAPAVSGVSCFPAPGALGLRALLSPRPPPPVVFFPPPFLFFFLPAFPLFLGFLFVFFCRWCGAGPVCVSSVQEAHGMNWIINVLPRRHGHLSTWQAAGSLSGMSMRWSRCRAQRRKFLAWTTRS